MVRAVEQDYAEVDRSRLAALSPAPDLSFVRWLSHPASLRHRLATLVADLSAPSLKDYRESAKERLHELFGVPAPDGEGLIPLSHMMHRPLSRIRDALLDEQQRPEAPAREGGETELVTLVLDLSRSPASNPSVVAQADGTTAFTPPDVSQGRWIAPDFPADWTGGHPCYVALIPSGPGGYTLFLRYGRYNLNHLREVPDVSLMMPQVGSMLLFRLPAGSLLRVVDTTSIEPNRFHVWTVSVDENPTMRGPVPTSY